MIPHYRLGLFSPCFDRNNGTPLPPPPFSEKEHTKWWGEGAPDFPIFVSVLLYNE